MYSISFGLVCHLRHCVVLPNDCLTLLAFLGWVQFHQRGLKCQKPSKSAAWSPWKDRHNGLFVVGPTGAGPHLQLLQLMAIWTMIFHFYGRWDHCAIPAFSSFRRLFHEGSHTYVKSRYTKSQMNTTLTVDGHNSMVGTCWYLWDSTPTGWHPLQSLRFN